MDRSLLTPAQLRVVDDLMALGQPRPSFSRDLPVRLRHELEDALAPLVHDLSGEGLVITKRRLAQVHACEAHFLAESRDGFAWTARSVRGTVVHKAVELSVSFPGEPAPLDLVDHAIAALGADDHRSSPRAWLTAASPLDLAELRAEANDVVVKFLECWPPLEAAWSPRAETGIGAQVCNDQIILRAKVDLVLGKPRGTEARCLVVDLKTGHSYPNHADDVRFYALVQVLRVGVPPFRIASYYLDTATFHYEDVTEDLLAATVHRVIDGVTKMIEIDPGGGPGADTGRGRDGQGPRPPVVTENVACTWCRLRHECDGARRWTAARSASGRPLDDVAFGPDEQAAP